MMMQPSTTIAIRYSTNFIILRNLETFESYLVFPLSNVWYVDIHIYFAPDFRKKDKEKWIYSMRIDSAVRSGSRFH